MLYPFSHEVHHRCQPTVEGFLVADDFNQICYAVCLCQVIVPTEGCILVSIQNASKYGRVLSEHHIEIAGTLPRKGPIFIP